MNNIGGIILKKVLLVSAGLLAGLTLTTVATISGSTSSSATVNASQVVQRTSRDSVNELSTLSPKQVAAAVLVAGAKDNNAWSSLKDSATNGDGGLEVQVSSIETGFTEPGTGSMYWFTLDGNDGMMINGYTLSQDGSTIYLYSEGERDSAERTTAPFKTMSAHELDKLAHQNATVDQIAGNVSNDVDD